ncbi:MAG TPA: TetR/AcrR family transcriptional regulator [Acidimicrobiales bacterium]
MSPEGKSPVRKSPVPKSPVRKSPVAKSPVRTSLRPATPARKSPAKATKAAALEGGRRGTTRRAADPGSSTVAGGGPAQERTLRSQGRKTLRKLLDAAIVVFDKRGYHAARVDDIVRLAETSHGTFYLYFSSKEDLFRALLADVSQEMTALSHALPPIGPNRAGYEALREWLDRFFEIYQHYHPVIRAWMESEVGNIDLGRLGAGVLGAFASTLVDRVREIDPPPVKDPEMAALAMVAMVERFSYYAVIQIVPLDREGMLDTTATILHNGLFGGARRRR